MKYCGYEVTKSSIGPGEILIVKVHELISAETADNIKAAIRGCLGNVSILIIDKGMDLSVLSNQDVTLRKEYSE